MKTQRAFLLALLLTLVGQQALAQNDTRVLSGRIVNTDGMPVEGAVVNVVEETRIAVTDKNGYFKLKKVKPSDDLIVTKKGYKSSSAVADFDTDFEVVIEKETDEYKQMMAMPYQNIQKKFVLGSASTTTGGELEKHPVTVLQNAFAGSVTGIQTYEARSEPGWSETDLYIRGLRTMNAGARKPLIIVDNVERDLSFLDAYPIETVTILKDAASTAIYGMRGANGVVLVTTKRGEAGRTRINFTQELGFQAISGIPTSQNAYNYALTMNQARYLDGMQPMFSDEDIEYYRQAANGTLDPSLRYKYISTNWHDEILRSTAPQHRTNLNISGGNNFARYFVSMSYLRQEGMYDSKWTEWNPGYSTQHVLNRFNLRSNIDIDVTKFLNVSLDLGGRIDNIRQPLASTWSIFTMAAESLPTNPVFTPNGSFYVPTENIDKNPAALIAMTGVDVNRRRNLYSNVTVTGDLDFVTKGLKAKFTAGFDAYNTFRYTQSQNFDAYWYDRNSGDASDPSSYRYDRMRTATALANPVSEPRDMNYNINLIGALTYDNVFAGKHAVSAQLMMRTYKNVLEGYQSSKRYLTYGGIANYIYDNRYAVQFTASYMGSDNYAPGERYAFFPGLSIGWIASEEDFVKNKDINLLKFRASLGRSGQAETGIRRYPYQFEYLQGGGYNFGTSQSYLQGVYESAAGSRNVKWELSDMLNLGVDFDFWNKKLYGQIDVFKEWRSNILISPAVPDIFGMAIPQNSYGKAETKGIEVTLGHHGNLGKFNYFVEGMLTYNTNRITEMQELAPAYDYQAKTGNRIGQAQIFMVSHLANDQSKIATSHQDAIDNPDKYPYQGSLKLGNAIYIDQNGDRVIDSYDMVPYGYGDPNGAPIPELIPSIKLGLEWKGFDARVLLTAFLNRTVACRENMDYGFGWGGTATHEVTNTWGYYTDDPNDPRNLEAKYPRLSTTFSANDRSYPRNQTSIWIRNGNFLSLRNVEVGYSLPEKLIAKLNMTKCRVYFSGYNLFTWSHFDNGFDPENPTNYIWAYPKTKSFSVGINIGF
ncbi:TonB-dependent receptor [Dysgonomonas sp. 511]|uniref:SusC/RagA family TonB-linked outer membrane protein n=1 Tax=Dysgonomonas sp. 511 TaxID=2302930 RepID=UPI002105E05E|nr:TonB-dependent receptor [Dysgonomonas sp. 511]